MALVEFADYNCMPCKRALPLLQANLYDLEHEVFTRKIPVMVVFEGWAGSGAVAR